MLPMVIAVLLAIAQEPLQVPPAPPPPTPRALLVEYLTAQNDASLADLRSHSHRELIVRHDRDADVRTETEVSCPAGFHMRVFHGNKLTTDFYHLNGREYRQVNGTWKSSPAPTGTGRCTSPENVKRYQVMGSVGFQRTLQRVDSIATTLHVQKGTVKVVRGARCQEWHLLRFYSPQPGEPASEATTTPETVCFDVSTHNLIERTGFGAQTVDYDWNKPVDIKPPQ